MINCLVLLDSENQLNEAELLLDWNPDFNFIKRSYTIKSNSENNILQVIKENNISRIIFLIGASTLYLNQSFKRDTAEISELDLPIICFNTNKCLGLDEDNCPKFIASIGAVHMPFTKKDVIFHVRKS